MCFIIAVAYLNTYLNTNSKESFHSGKQTYILLGDSILNNNAYVNDGKSVENLLYERTNGKTICLAKDNSKIIHIYSQLEAIPESLNNNFTTIFLSVGGNDILSFLEEQEKNVKKSNKNNAIDSIFDSYKNLIKSIQSTIPNANLVLLDIYFPIKWNIRNSILILRIGIINFILMR